MVTCPSSPLSSVTSPELSRIPFHPCLNDEAHGQVARLHLPIAPECNLACSYCERILSTDPDLPGPGTAAKVMSVSEAVETSLAFIDEYGPGSIIGVAGPGDPLANDMTYICLEQVKEVAPEVQTCLCTNGLVLPDNADRLIELGIGSLTVTVNGVSPATVAAIQPRVCVEGQWISGEEGAELLIARQLEGIERIAAAGIVVKVNMVIAPQINMHEAALVAQTAARLGARVFNPMPLIPRHALKDFRKPTHSEMASVREACGKSLYVFTKCKQCRADAAGIPGKEMRECRMNKGN